MEKHITLKTVDSASFVKRRIIKSSNIRYGSIFIYVDADPDG